jgi:hypothetical protein
VLRLTTDGQLDPSFGGGDGISTPQAGQPRYCCPTRRCWTSPPRRGSCSAESPIALDVEPLLLFRLLPDGSVDRGFGRNGHVARGDDAATVTFTPFALSTQRDALPGQRPQVESLPRQRGVEALPPSQAGGPPRPRLSATGWGVGGGIYVREGKGEHFRPVLRGADQADANTLMCMNCLVAAGAFATVAAFVAIVTGQAGLQPPPGPSVVFAMWNWRNRWKYGWRVSMRMGSTGSPSPGKADLARLSSMEGRGYLTAQPSPSPGRRAS